MAVGVYRFTKPKMFLSHFILSYHSLKYFTFLKHLDTVVNAPQAEGNYAFVGKILLQINLYCFCGSGSRTAYVELGQNTLHEPYLCGYYSLGIPIDPDTEVLWHCGMRYSSLWMPNICLL